MRYALKASETLLIDFIFLPEGDIENFCGIDWDLICQKIHSFFCAIQYILDVRAKSKTAYGCFAYILFIILVLVMVMVLVLVTVDFPMDCPVDYPAGRRNS